MAKAGIVTSHAISRYRKRVEPVSYDEAIQRMDTPAVRQAIAFGASAVVLPTGQRLVIADGKIVTVNPKSTHQKWGKAAIRARKCPRRQKGEV